MDSSYYHPHNAWPNLEILLGPIGKKKKSHSTQPRRDTQENICLLIFFYNGIVYTHCN
jgi:hypothetical protein